MRNFAVILALSLAGCASASGQIEQPPEGQARIVFIGDSITEYWVRDRPAFFSENDYINRGIGGQTSGDVLNRFQKDVIDLRPDEVLILVGTNDVAANGGPVTDEQVIENLKAMAGMAHQNKIKVVVGSIPPATRFPWNPSMMPSARIIALDNKIQAWASADGLVYADFWAALALPDGGLNPKYTNDGVHPSVAGYEVMEPIAKMSVEKALTAEQ